MATARPDPVTAAHDALIANINAMLTVRGMKKAHLARKVAAIGGPTKKTIYNILSKTHPPNIKTWGALAKALGAPLWVLLIPGLHEHEELLTVEAMTRMERLMDSYVAADPEHREEIETVAIAAAIRKRAKNALPHPGGASK